MPKEGPKMAAGGTHNYKADLIKGVHAFLPCPAAANLSVKKRPEVLFGELEKARHVFLLENLTLSPYRRIFLRPATRPVLVY